MKRRIALMMTTVLMLAACGGSASTTTTFAAGATTTVAPDAFYDDQSGEGAEEGVGVVTPFDRKVIYDGRMELEAAQTRATFDRLTALVQGSGGFVSAATVQEVADEDDQPFISMTVRVPADRLTATLVEIRRQADRVVSESLSSQDVTDEFVDIEAQLRNLQALETELLALLAELRDNTNADPAKLLQVFDQIRQTRGEIEQLQGRKQLLENLVALATIEIGISPLASAASIVPEPAWEPGTVAKAALRDTVEALQAVADFLIRFTLNVLPILAVTLGPIAGIGWLVWRRWRRQTTATVTPTT